MTRDLRREPHYALYALGGFAAFLIATAAIRVTPAKWIEATDIWALAANGLIAGLVVLGIVMLVRPLAPEHRAGAAAAFATPGMICDAFVTGAFGQIFPHVDPDLDGIFGASMLAGYALIIVTGLVMARLPARSTA